RANVWARLTGPRKRRTSVPVQVIVPAADPFLEPALYDGLTASVPRLWRSEIAAGHWVQLSHPRVVAQRIGDFVAGFDSCGRVRHKLVLVMGAGSGIWRATALAFAEQGAEVVVADIDLTRARRTARLASLLGPRAHAFDVDVSDRDAFDLFNARVTTE